MILVLTELFKQLTGLKVSNGAAHSNSQSVSVRDNIVLTHLNSIQTKGSNKSVKGGVSKIEYEIYINTLIWKQINYLLRRSDFSSSISIDCSTALGRVEGRARYLKISGELRNMGSKSMARIR